MRFVFPLCLILSLSAALLTEDKLFAIIPQPVGGRQWSYILVALASFVGLTLLHLKRVGRNGLYLFFFLYPFLAQSIYYLNVSAPFIVLSPAFLYLTIHLLLRRNHAMPVSLQILFLFCLSTIVSVLVADNKYTAFAFFVLAIGGFTLSTYLVYVGVRTSRNPMLFLRRIILSILAGSVLYFAIETVAFQIRPYDVIHILLRRWNELPLGRYYTGGYKEPAGLGFVFSLLFWVMLVVSQTRTVPTNRKRQWVDKIALLTMVFFIIVAGTRGAVVNLVNILLVLWLLRRLRLQSVYRLKKSHILVILVVAGIGSYLLLPRTILTPRSQSSSSSVEPTYLSIGQHTFQLVGTTPGYVRQTIVTLQDFLRNPLGSGPLNAPPIWNSSEGAVGYYYSILSNLFVVGATFGWLSLLLWLGFICYVAHSLFRLGKYSRNEQWYALSVVFLAILLASLLPGSYYLGPNLNWSNFDSRMPLSPNTRGLPADYPAIISGVIVGGLLGLIERVKMQHVFQLSSGYRVE